MSCSSATSCTFTADFNTINDTNDGPNEIIVTASDLAGNPGSDRKLVMVDNTPPVIGSSTMDKAEYLVGDTILVNASNVNDSLPSNVLDALNSIAAEPSGVAGVGANVTTTLGVQPTQGAGVFLGDYNALTQDGTDQTLFSSPADFLADAAGEITATALAVDNVGNLSDSLMTNATGYNSTNLICEPASVTSGRTATLFLGRLINTTPNPDEPVANQPALIQIFDTNNVLMFSDQVLTDAEGKVNVTNAFNLAHGTYKLMLTYGGTGPTAPFLSSSSCYSEPGFLVRSLANGGGYVSLATTAKNGRPYKGTFGFYLDVTSGFVANDSDGLLNDPASPVTYTGSMNFVDHSTKGHYQALTIDTLSWEGSTGIKFGGTGRYRHPGLQWSEVNYELTVHDNGNPGNARAILSNGAGHSPDTFELEAAGWTTPDPTLQGGNITVRQ